MTDLSPTIIAKSDQLNADDLIGRSITINIRDVTGHEGEQPISVHYEGDNGKPWKPCKSMRRVLAHIWGSEGKKYIGRSLTLYRDDKVKFGGLEVGGTRISHMSHITSAVTMALTASKANKKPFTVQPLKSAPAQAEIDPAVITAGATAAGKGVTAYVAWRDALPPAVKESIKPHNADWSKAAKAADAAAASKVDEEIPV